MTPRTSAASTLSTPRAAAESGQDSPRLGRDSNAADFFVCRLTDEKFTNPAILASGHTFEFDAIAHWLSTSRRALCPGTNRPLTHRVVAPNWQLRQAMEASGLVLERPFAAQEIRYGSRVFDMASAAPNDVAAAQHDAARRLTPARIGHMAVLVALTVGLSDLAARQNLPWAKMPLWGMAGLGAVACRAARLGVDDATWSRATLGVIGNVAGCLIGHAFFLRPGQTETNGYEAVVSIAAVCGSLILMTLHVLQ